MPHLCKGGLVITDGPFMPTDWRRKAVGCFIILSACFHRIFLGCVDHMHAPKSDELMLDRILCKDAPVRTRSYYTRWASHAKRMSKWSFDSLHHSHFMLSS